MKTNLSTLTIHRAHRCPAAADVSPRTLNREKVSADSRRRLPSAGWQRSLAVFAALSLLLISGNITQAETTAVSNLANADTQSCYPIGYRVPGWSQGASFTTGADPVTLSSVTLPMNTADGSTDGGFTVGLYTDAAGLPGTLIVALAGNPDPATAGNHVYTAPGGTTLLPATTYWIVAADSTPAELVAYCWSTTLNLTEMGLSGWSLGDSRALLEFPHPWRAIGAGVPFRMAVNIVDETPADLINDLIVEVNGLSGVKSATKNSLVVKLNAALKALSLGDTATACARLQDFIGLCVSQAGKKQISVAQANDLIADAVVIQTAIGCP